MSASPSPPRTGRTGGKPAMRRVKLRAISIDADIPRETYSECKEPAEHVSDTAATLNFSTGHCLMIPLSLESVTAENGNPTTSSSRSCSDFKMYSMADSYDVEQSLMDKESRITWTTILERLMSGSPTSEGGISEDTERGSLVSSRTSHTEAFSKPRDDPVSAAEVEVRDKESQKKMFDWNSTPAASPSKFDSVFSPDSPSLVRHGTRSRISNPRSRNHSILSETNAAFDILFGYRSESPKTEHMEIPLKTRKGCEEVEEKCKCFSKNPHSIDRSQSVDCMCSCEDILRENLSHSQSTDANAEAKSSAVHSFSEAYHKAETPRESRQMNKELKKFMMYFLMISHVCYARAHMTIKKLVTAETEELYELLRLQPYSYSSYMRGMLWAGASSLSFNCYSLYLIFYASTIEVERLSSLQCHIYSVLKIYLVMHFILNCIQLPGRIVLHFRFWDCSRAVDIDAALLCLRKLMDSITWKLNRATGTMQDILSVLCLIFGEVFLRLSTPESPLHDTVTAVCATVLLALFIRLFVALLLVLSNSDPQTVHDARKRGLARVDLDALPTNVFTPSQEGCPSDCAICLTEFGVGEMVSSLKCDKKHCFHAGCIRSWLERQNSCPLCQKIV